MNNLLLFSLILVFGGISVGGGTIYLRYKGTIVFPTAMIVLISSLFVGIVAYSVAELGLKALYWAFPLSFLEIMLVNVIFKKLIQKPLLDIDNILSHIAKGELDLNLSEKEFKKNNELGAVAKSLNKTIEGLHNTSKFADEISKGNFEAEYELLSENDEIGHALLNMRKSLLEASIKEKERKAEEEKERYVTNGIAKFNDLLRVNSNNIAELSRNLLSQLVDYINANQAGLFVINDQGEDKVAYEMAGAVAYNREKLIKKDFLVGEGLVGKCAFEKKPIILTDVPENYVQITSGLGTANPSCIVLMPAISEDKVIAVLEIASFKKLESHVITFIEKVCENIAGVIQSVRNNERTKLLLDESQKNREAMLAQEEELRQNLEEMQATQEEVERKEEKLDKLTAELKEKEKEINKKMEAL